MSASLRRAALLAPLALAAFATAARGDYREAYVDGLKALRRGDLDAAVERLRAAAAERPQELARARLVGLIPEPYLPHHHLGLAYYRLRRCAEALAELEISARQGAVAQLPALAGQARAPRQACGALVDAESAVAAGRAAAAALATSAVDPAAWPPASEARRREAAATLEAAAADVEAARRSWDLQAAANAGRRAAQARDTLATLQREREAATSRAARTTAGAPEVAASGGSPAAAGPQPSSPAPGGDATAAPSSPPAAGRAEPAAGTASDGVAPSEVRAAAAGTPALDAALSPGLAAGVQAYLDGEYARAVDLLLALPPATDRAAFLASLFRAAARHALYLVGGERDRPLLAAAAADLRAARRAKPDFRPTTRDFSPRFVDFFAATR